jgi:hypothetical protein
MYRLSDYPDTSYPSIIRRMIELAGIHLELAYDIHKCEYGTSLASQKCFIEIQLLKSSNGTYQT